MNRPFRGRPGHPDMALLSAVILAMDIESEAGGTPESILGRRGIRIDPDTMRYCALQRAMRAEPHVQRAGGTMLNAMLGGVWVDGFAAGLIAGQQLAKRREGTRDDSGAAH